MCTVYKHFGNMLQWGCFLILMHHLIQTGTGGTEIEVEQSIIFTIDVCCFI